MVLPRNFVPINQTATDFFLTVKQHYGMIALRKGYYNYYLHRTLHNF
jgi:hypothetical protein